MIQYLCMFYNPAIRGTCINLCTLSCKNHSWSKYGCRCRLQLSLFFIVSGIWLMSARPQNSLQIPIGMHCETPDTQNRKWNENEDVYIFLFIRIYFLNLCWYCCLSAVAGPRVSESSTSQVRNKILLHHSEWFHNFFLFIRGGVFELWGVESN